MAERDTRPAMTPMPDHLIPILDRHGPALRQLLDEVFADVLASTADRPHAELVNDAISMQAQFAAQAALTVAASLEREKGWPSADCWEVAIVNIQQRVQMLFATADAVARETRQ